VRARVGQGRSGLPTKESGRAIAGDATPVTHSCMGPRVHSLRQGKGTTQKEAHPSAATFAFFSSASELFATIHTDLARHYGSLALKAAEEASIPRRQAMRHCEECGIYLSPQTISSIHLATLSKRSRKRTSEGLSGNQKNQVAIVRTCSVCSRGNVQPFISLSAAQQLVAKETAELLVPMTQVEPLTAMPEKIKGCERVIEERPKDDLMPSSVHWESEEAIAVPEVPQVNVEARAAGEDENVPMQLDDPLDMVEDMTCLHEARMEDAEQDNLPMARENEEIGEEEDQPELVLPLDIQQPLISLPGRPLRLGMSFSAAQRWTKMTRGSSKSSIRAIHQVIHKMTRRGRKR
jgi:hypothetical protein